MKDIILKINNIVKEFGEAENRIKVLKGISFDINAEEFTSIMGPSGCGKSTLLYIIGGLLKPTQGQIIFDGHNIFELNEQKMSEMRHSMFSFIFQFYNLVQNLSVEENILLPIIMSGKKVSSYKKELENILEIVQLSNYKKYYPYKLSGGQQQRVAVARAVISSPKIILADEPIGNLDYNSGKSVMELFSRINKEKKITILQVTHSKEAAYYGNRIIHLLDGTVLKDEMLRKGNE